MAFVGSGTCAGSTDAMEATETAPPALGWVPPTTHDATGAAAVGECAPEHATTQMATAPSTKVRNCRVIRCVDIPEKGVTPFDAPGSVDGTTGYGLRTSYRSSTMPLR